MSAVHGLVNVLDSIFESRKRGRYFEVSWLLVGFFQGNLCSYVTRLYTSKNIMPTKNKCNI